CLAGELEIGKPLYGGIQSLRWFLVPLLPKPHFLKRALREDWVKTQLNTEYCWQADGSFDQIR
ncbi:hypothetical protein ACRCPG_33060, partial [Pseudomonas aeruginosa]